MAEAKEDLQLALDSLKQQFKLLKNELESKNNQLCEYKNQLTLVKERETHYLHEINVLQSNENPEVNKLYGRIKQLQEEMSQLNKHFDLELSKHDDEIIRLRDEVRVLSDVANPTEKLDVTIDDFFEENSLLEKEVQELNNDLCEKQLYAEQLKRQNINLCESFKSLCLELKQIRESVECKKQELIEAYDLMNALQEDILLTKTELNSLKNNSIKPDDENSLFAEVNDRRLKLQETLISFTEKCNKMRQEISRKQKQISVLRLQHDELQNLLKNDPLECEQDYKILIDTYLSRISTLENLFEEYEKLISEREELVKNGLPNNTVDLLNNITEANRKNEAKLNEAVGMEFRAQKMMSIQLKEISLKIQEWKATTEQLQTKLCHCGNSIQKENENCEDSVGNIRNQHNYEDKMKSIANCDKINILEEANTNEINSRPTEKKVMFTADTIDSKSSSSHVVRKGRKVLQCKPVYIPSLVKKK